MIMCRSPEEALVRAVVEARRAAPAILFLPHLHLWWETAPASLRAILTMLLADLPPDLPLLLLATADVPAEELDADALKLFGNKGRFGNVVLALCKLPLSSPCCLLAAADLPCRGADADAPCQLGNGSCCDRSVLLVCWQPCI